MTAQGRLFGKDLFRKDKNVVKRIEKLTRDIAVLEAKIEDIKSGAIYRNAFEWRFEFPEVLDEKTGEFTGFDIIIGNPPYGVKVETKAKELFKKQFADVHMRTPDTYIYFISQAFRLTGRKCLANFIVPNNLFYQNENEKARQLLLDKRLVAACNLGDNIFGDANVPTCVFVAENQSTQEYKFNYADYRDWNGDASRLFLREQMKEMEAAKVYSLPGRVFGVDTESVTILEKVREMSVSIDEVAEEMASGISTGGDKVFRMPKQKAEELSLEKGLLRPVLVGGEIDRYLVENTNNVLIYTTKKVS